MIYANADFSTIITAIRNCGNASVVTRKHSVSKRKESLLQWQEIWKSSIDELPSYYQQWGYSQDLMQRDKERCERTLNKILANLDSIEKKELPERPPLGAVLIYASFGNSPWHFINSVLTAWALGNSALILADDVALPFYSQWIHWAEKCGFTPNSLQIISTLEPDGLETLIEHPSLKAIHFRGFPFEGEFLKKSKLPYLHKKIKISYGSKNTLAFLNDADLTHLNELFEQCLFPYYWCENSFSRWFVQEKNYEAFLQKLDECIEKYNSPLNIPANHYQKAYEEQMISLLKEKNWKSYNNNSFYINKDFNNCSPWQQQSTLGQNLTITRFKNIFEGAKFINTTQYATAVSIFSANESKFLDFRKELNAPHILHNNLPSENYLDRTCGELQCGIGNQVSDWDFFQMPLA